jgi:NAD(P)-dependent dehydrogenase (short-subunit alcohol dehydrogenase family)
MKDLTIFVTGAGGGIGLALAAGLLEKGCRVFAGAHRPGEGSLAELSRVHGARLAIVPIDVGSDESVAHAESLVAERADHVDLVLNVAGMLGDIETAMPGAIDFSGALEVYNVNALGPLRVTNAFFPLLLAGTTRTVVNISSDTGSIGACDRDAWYAYCMSKAALNMASALTHNRLRPHKGRVLVVHPGWVRTMMRGTLDVAAPLLPVESAAAVLTLVERALGGGEAFDGPRPAFLDWRGQPMPW